MSARREPPDRLVQQVKQLLGPDEEIDHLVVGHVGLNPMWALALAFLSLLVVFIFEVNFVGAAVLTVAYLTIALIWIRPASSRLIVATGTGLVVLDATKGRFRPKGVIRRLPPTHRLGRLDGHLFGSVDAGDGERAWVSTGFRATVDAIDGSPERPPAGRSALPPKQRLFRRRDDRG